MSALRSLMVQGSQSTTTVATYLGVLCLTFVVLPAIGARLYPGLAR